MCARLFTVAASLCLTTAVVTPAFAQSPTGDSLPFKKGQWAIESSIAYGSLGVIRFFSPRSAMVVGISSYVFGEKNRDDDETENFFGFSNLGVQVGPRIYRPVSGNAATFLSTGLTVSHRTQRQSYRRESSMSYGIMGGAGGAYFPGRRLSVQVMVTSTASYLFGKTDFEDNTFASDFTTRGYSITPLSADVSATFYFR
jgi:hypothetical protein